MTGEGNHTADDAELAALTRAEYESLSSEIVVKAHSAVLRAFENSNQNVEAQSAAQTISYDSSGAEVPFPATKVMLGPGSPVRAVHDIHRISAYIPQGWVESFSDPLPFVVLHVQRGRESVFTYAWHKGAISFSSKEDLSDYLTRTPASNGVELEYVNGLPHTIMELQDLGEALESYWLLPQ